MATHFLIAEKFNQSNLSKFDTLAASDKLTFHTVATAGGALLRVSETEARRHILRGGNVYCDVAVNESEAR